MKFYSFDNSNSEVGTFLADSVEEAKDFAMAQSKTRNRDRLRSIGPADETPEERADSTTGFYMKMMRKETKAALEGGMKGRAEFYSFFPKKIDGSRREDHVNVWHVEGVPMLPKKTYRSLKKKGYDLSVCPEIYP